MILNERGTDGDSCSLIYLRLKEELPFPSMTPHHCAGRHAAASVLRP